MQRGDDNDLWLESDCYIWLQERIPGRVILKGLLKGESHRCIREGHHRAAYDVAELPF